MISLVCLNTYMGKADPAGQLQYLASLKDTTDVFCFQEMSHTKNPRLVEYPDAMKGRANWYNEIAAILPDHQGYFSASSAHQVQQGLFAGDRIKIGIASFVRKSIRIVDRKVKHVHKHYKTLTTSDLPLPRVAELLILRAGTERYRVIHFHGLWDHTGRGKIDLLPRIQQSLRVRELNVGAQKGSKLILMGDFNLDPILSPYSLGLLEKMHGGMVNLIRTRAVMSTRSSLYPRSKQSRFADYVFVSPNITVHEFSVPQTPVISDHCPMLLTCT